MVNFSIMIPLLEVLFNQVDYNLTHNNLNNNEFNFSIEYIKTSFYTYFNEIILTKGRKEGDGVGGISRVIKYLNWSFSIKVA